jgi:hypothetical protein
MYISLIEGKAIMHNFGGWVDFSPTQQHKMLLILNKVSGIFKVSEMHVPPGIH